MLLGGERPSGPLLDRLRHVVQAVRPVLVRGEHALRLDVRDGDGVLLLAEDDRPRGDALVARLARSPGRPAGPGAARRSRCRCHRG